jgi:hypothetical protein
MTTLTLIFPEGARTDPPEAPGATFLLGRVLEAQAERALLPLGGSLGVQVEQDQVSLVLSVPSPAWEEGWARVEQLLEVDRLSADRLEETRARRLDELLFQQGTPVSAFLAAWHRHALAVGLPPEVDAGRPVGGTIEGVRNVTVSTLEARRRDIVQIERSRAILMAPPSPESPAEESFHVAEPSGGGRAAPVQGVWEGARLVVDRDLTSAWLGVAWAIPPQAHWLTSSFLAQRLQELLSPSLPEPGVFRTEVAVTRAGGQAFLTVLATVDPAVTLRREQQILDALQALATEAMGGLGLELAQRRWKSQLAALRSQPIEEGQWLARNLPEDATELLPDGDALRGLLAGTVIRDLASALPPARILLYGPVPMMEP